MSTSELSKADIILAAEQIINVAHSPARSAQMPPALKDLVTSGIDDNDMVRLVATVIRKMNVDAIHAAYEGRHPPTGAMQFTDADLEQLMPPTTELGQGYTAQVIDHVKYHLDEERHPLLHDGQHDALGITQESVERSLQAAVMNKHGISTVADFGAVMDDIPLLKNNGHLILGQEAGMRSVLRALEMEMEMEPDPDPDLDVSGRRLIYGGEVLQALITQHNQLDRVLPKPFGEYANPKHLATFRGISNAPGLPASKQHAWPEPASVMRTLVGVNALIDDLASTPASTLTGLDGTPFDEQDKAYYVDRLSAMSKVLHDAAVSPAKALNAALPFDDALRAHQEANDPSISLFTLTKDVDHAARPLPEGTPITGALGQRSGEAGVVVVSDRQVAHAMAAKFNLGLAEHKVSRNTLYHDFNGIDRTPVEAERIKVGLLALYDPQTDNPLRDALAFADEMGYAAGTPEGDVMREALATHWQQPGVVDDAKHGCVASEVMDELKGQDALAINRDPEPTRATRSIA